MGPALGELFHVLSNELTWTHWKWKQYRILYGDKESRIDVLNEVAPVFFRIVQDVLFEETLLSIARFVSPVRSAGKDQLTVRRLPPLITEPSLRSEMEQLVAAAGLSAKFAVDWRHRRIAHRELPLALGSPAAPLAPASRQAVEDALDALRRVLNRLQGGICNATTAYQFSPTTGDAESLLYVLRDGLLRQRERHERWEKGELHVDDLKPPADL